MDSVRAVPRRLLQLLAATLLGSLLTVATFHFSTPWGRRVDIDNLPGDPPAVALGAGTQKALPRFALPRRHNLPFATLPPKAFVTRVDAKTLITGAGAVISKGSVLFDAASGEIVYAGESQSAPNLTVNVSYAVQVVMPGLWDCHTHFMGNIGGGLFEDAGFMSAGFPTNYVKFHSALRELEDALLMGITSVRELGGMFGQAIRELERTGQIVAPHFHYAGRAIGMTGGHTDDQLMPLDEFRRLDAQRLSGGTLCDGVPECLKRVRENLRMQADVIKVMTTGGVLSEFDQPTDAQLSKEEIEAIVKDAARAKRIVAAHAHGSEGIQSAIDGGVTTLEHGSFMTRAQAQLIKKKGYMVYTPTVTVDQYFFNRTERPPNLDENQWRKGRAMLRSHMSSVRVAIEEGVPIVAGTDCPNGCAMVGSEVNYLHQFGMTPLEAIRTATSNAPRCLGQLGLAPRSGHLAAGYVADVIALDTNPLEQLEVLTKAERITHVWKAGSLMKSPGSSSTAQRGMHRSGLQWQRNHEGNSGRIMRAIQ